MKLNKFSLTAVLLLSLSLFSNPLKAEPKWWDEWVEVLRKAWQSQQPKPNKPKKGEVIKTAVFEFATIDEAAGQAVKILNEDKFKIWDVHSAGSSCQADAVFIRDLKRANLGRGNEVLIAILLTYRDPTKVGKPFEDSDLIENLVFFGLLPQSALKDMSKNGRDNLLRATRKTYMYMMVSHFGYKNPEEILGQQGSRFPVKDEHKIEFYRDVFRAFRKGPVVLALYEGFPILDETEAFTGVKYLFVFDFDGQRWVLRTKPKDVNKLRFGLGPYITPSPREPRGFALTMNPDTPWLYTGPWLNPGFVDEGVGPDEGENVLVTHVGGLWHPGSTTPTLSFVEEIGLTQLELENFLNDSVLGKGSSVVDFSIIHHNYIQKFSKRFFENIRGFATQPPVMQLCFQGAPIHIEGQNSDPCYIQSTPPGAFEFGYGDPSFTITALIKGKSYNLRLPSKKKPDSYIHNFAKAKFTVADSNRPEYREPGTLIDWKLLMGAIRPYVTTNMAPKAIEEFSRVGITEDNFDWWQNVLGQVLLVNDADVDFPDIEVKFIEKSLGQLELNGEPYRVLEMTMYHDGLIEHVLEPLEVIRLEDGSFELASAEQLEPGADALFSEVGLTREAFINAVADAWFDQSSPEDDVLIDLITQAMAEEGVHHIGDWMAQFQNSARKIGLVHLKLLSRIFHIRFKTHKAGKGSHVYEPLAEISKGLINSQLSDAELTENFQSMNLEGPLTPFDPISSVPKRVRLRAHPPNSAYRGPHVVGDVINAWYKPYEPHRKKSVLLNRPTLKPREANWKSVLRATVLKFVFDQRLLGERQIMGQALGSSSLEVVYDPRDPQTWVPQGGVTFNQETGEPQLTWDDTEPEQLETESDAFSEELSISKAIVFTALASLYAITDSLISYERG